MYDGGRSRDSEVEGSGAVCVDGESNGLSEIGDDVREEERDDDNDGRDEFDGVMGGKEFVMVVDLSRALALVVNCPPRFRG